MHRAASARVLCALFALAAVDVQAHDTDRVRDLEARVEDQNQIIRSLRDQLERLEQRLDATHGSGQGARDSAPAAADTPPPSPAHVDLSGDELPAIPSEQQSTEVLARPWYRNLTLSGFGTGGAVWTEDAGSDSHASFLTYQGQLEVDAEAWEAIHVYSELSLTQVGHEDDQNVRVGELYVHFRDAGETFFRRPGTVGVKVGRMDIPFGEDYLTRDVLDNPLVTWSAAIPYGIDEGIVVHAKLGEQHKWGWTAGWMNGNLQRSHDDDLEKFLSFKLHGNPTDDLYVSASGYWNGDTDSSAIGLGGTYFMPVGSWGYTSTNGISGSDEVDAYSYELDARYAFNAYDSVKVQFGQVFVDDDDAAFDRTIYYGQVEPLWNLGRLFAYKAYLAARVSMVGTFDDNEGYIFEGRPFAEGSDSFGYDARSLGRWAIAAGYRPNERTLLKVEYSLDDFDLIDASPLRGHGRRRSLAGGVVAVGF